MSSGRLYTPALLAAAVELSRYPLLESAPYRGSARASTCGSTLEMNLVLGEGGKIERIGLLVRACAVGQASAAMFARHATGRGLGEIEAANKHLTAWLAGDAPPPDWPDLALIAPARDYPARHGAMLLPWKAALAALSTTPVAS